MYNVHDGNEQCKNVKRQMRLLAGAFAFLRFDRAKPVSESPKGASGIANGSRLQEGEAREREPEGCERHCEWKQ